MTRDGDTVTVTCVSLHLTSFAVLVDVGGAQVQVAIVCWHAVNESTFTTVNLLFIYTCACISDYNYRLITRHWR